MLIFSATIVTSCKKGDVGPVGANANIITLANATVAYDDWFLYDPKHGMMYSVEIQADMVTREVIDNMAVLGYVEKGNDAWAPLPYEYALGAVIQYILTPGHIRLITYNSGIHPDLLTVKFIAIPLKEKKAHLDYARYLNNYFEKTHVLADKIVLSK